MSTKKESNGSQADFEKTLPQDDSDDDKETMCGIGNYHPSWLQMFANTKFFLINFSIVAVLQGAYFTFMIGSMSTLEKRYAFESKVSGFILIADNLSQMFVSPVIGYLGTKYNRSRIIATGELLVAFSCFLTAIPYFIYGPATHFISDTGAFSNITKYEVCAANDYDLTCKLKQHSTVIPAVVLIWLGSFINGLGYTAFYTIGLPYLDDNVKKKNSPIYLSTSATLRLLGPTFGFLLSSVCLRWYENPLLKPDISRNDPRWIGAWWIGFLILGVLIALFSLPMFLFPRQFKKASVNLKKIVEEDVKTAKVPKLQEIKTSLKRLLKNPVLMFHATAGIFRIVGYLGYYIFKPKFLEMQYRQTASSASFFTGTTSVGTMAVGIMAGGYIIKRFKPKPKSLVLWMYSVELVPMIAIFAGMFLGCDVSSFAETAIGNDGRMILESPSMCNSHCTCTTRVYQPICTSTGESTFFSPCYAGCTTIDRSTSPISFKDCSCIRSATENKDFGFATAGYCPQECNRFAIYIIMFAIASAISSTARTGNTLITLRCVDPKDKSFAMGVIGSLFAVFAFIPYPLIYGAITDSACVVWEESCGKTGNCWVYDTDKFRYYLHGASFAFVLIGNLFDIGVIIYADRIKDMFNDDEEVELKEGTQQPLTQQENDVI